MPEIKNISERLINTHDFTMIPPGATVMISDEAAAHATITELVTAGVLETVGGAATAARSQQSPNTNNTANRAPGAKNE
jgi:hypothetical protein